MRRARDRLNPSDGSSLATRNASHRAMASTGFAGRKVVAPLGAQTETTEKLQVGWVRLFPFFFRLFPCINRYGLNGSEGFSLPRDHTMADARRLIVRDSSWNWPDRLGVAHHEANSHLNSRC